MDISSSLVSHLLSFMCPSYSAHHWGMPTDPLYQGAQASEEWVIGPGGFRPPCSLPPLAGEPGFLDLGHHHQVLVHPEQLRPPLSQLTRSVRFQPLRHASR